MALHRSPLSARRGSKNDSQKDDDDSENNGYVQVLVKPLEQGNLSLILNWLGRTASQISCQHLGAVYGVIVAVSLVVSYQLLRCDIGSVFHRLCGILVPMFTIVQSFFWLSIGLRKTWSCTSVYLLFASCFVGETIAQVLIQSWSEGETPSPAAGVEGVGNYSQITQPLVVFVVLFAVCSASVFSTLETQHSVVVIFLVSFTRFLACSTLGDIPQSVRPYLSYLCGLTGIFISKYMETIFKPQINNFMTQDGKIPAYKRRSSSSSQGGFPATRATANHTRDRRVSLPALGKSQIDFLRYPNKSSSSFESAILGEAHGLITDMLADQSLPLNIVSGLRTLSNLLKPPESHSSFHKTRVSPLVSLTESTSYGSDTEENPYTGERPSTKKSRRSLPPSLIRRMSTSTWTTTTSATGMPTLELEPCRIRSSSFRHNRDGTPGSSPVGSRSNSPSPSSPTVVLSIPKSRSFSLVTPTPIGGSHPKRPTRKSVTSNMGTEVSGISKSSDYKQLSPLVKDELDYAQEKGDKRSTNSASFRRINMTSDYESNDSPNSSDHSDNVTAYDEVAGSPPKKVIYSHGTTSSSQKSWVIHDRRLKENVDMAEDADEEDESELTAEEVDGKSSVTSPTANSVNLPWEIENIDDCELLHIHRLNEWDYPIFDLANQCSDTILSKVGYKLFLEVGLFETFRIPVAPFLHYFHALEKGYRDKPYHNRIHATDVLHGVYYLTTQPIPGFTQVNTSTNMFSRNGSSSDSDVENSEKSLTYRANSFASEDYGIMGGNFPALELMALYTAAAMHDFDHPGRTNAFLVATNAKEAVLYNDRSVLENHHAAQAWSLFMKEPILYNFLCGLEAAEFKRFRFLVIENILATDLKRHFEILAEFNAKVNDEDAVGIDWTSETDRLLMMQMVIKLADINGPAKKHDLHVRWTERISEEFYEQGDEEARLGMPISPYMDRRIPQLAKLQETFINHLVAPLCNAMVTAGFLPGTWADDQEISDEEEEGEDHSDTDQIDLTGKDSEDETETDGETGPICHEKCKKKPRKINCLLTKNLKENHEYWVAKIQEEEKQKANNDSTNEISQETQEVTEMESIKEEVESQASNNSTQPSTPTKDCSQSETT
ncbi:cGMP-inhibited 3',5'-cyclic phosphodiesterase 3A-like isoform X2 [Saccostrea echinata]|uniref:cGMP-inhibited 3',5'-cyclic phosphodiesterase 3A-like isoform X2 n=1 Tax=Saccostrea echinata TaxID=191078 RepID=UPI002A82E7FA|nr:cGMP-inhibited 3',5'-cyclic phosphodiesterase 3A-like isoform X2 [Saccostrea echinata]